MSSIRDTYAVVMAGGIGKRLGILTRDRAKPEIVFGGNYRVIDFTLSNIINSDIERIMVLTQTNATSLNNYLANVWIISGNNICIASPRLMEEGDFYRGTADAVFQNLEEIFKSEPEHIAILSGDHIYMMDYTQMLAQHIKRGADLTIATVPVPIEFASEYGIASVNGDWRVTNFQEKPKEGILTIPGQNKALASMGVYIFKAECLKEALQADQQLNTEHDFGKNVVPMLINQEKKVYAYDFRENNLKGNAEHNQGYWRDVGSIQQYYDANMELLELVPRLNLYNRHWPILHEPDTKYPGTKTVHDLEGRVGDAHNSIVCNGGIISGARVKRSMLSPRVHVHSYTTIENSILFPDIEIGEHCNIKNTIVDEENHIPSWTEIGVNREADNKRGFVIANGITVVPSGYYKG